MCWAKGGLKWNKTMYITCDITALKLTMRIWRPRRLGLSVFNSVVVVPCLRSVDQILRGWKRHWALKALCLSTLVWVVFLTIMGIRAESHSLFFFSSLGFLELLFALFRFIFLLHIFMKCFKVSSNNRDR